MSRLDGELVYRRMRAPSAHGLAFKDPSWESLAAPKSLMFADDEHDFPVLDTTRIGVARDARRDLLQSAVNAHGESPNVDARRPIIMSGHQPELFHPGVWFKNFALAELANRLDAIAVNLVIDSDLCRSTSIRCPRYVADLGDLDDPRSYRVEPLEFDAAGEAEPFEERRVKDIACFRSFSDRASDSMRGIVDDPIVGQMWPELVRVSNHESQLAELLAAGRRLVEAKVGVCNWETPQSEVCETDSFRRFLMQLLVRAEEFAELHNASLDAYRRVNRIRSQSHPAPRLTNQANWIETPFWIWTKADTQRRRAYVRRFSNGDLLFGSPDFLEIPLPSPQNSVDAGLNALREASNSGACIRSRALATTMYARLFLSDLFLHGIGGAKYDQLTDELSRRFWQVDGPPFATVTATTQLPLPQFGINPEMVRECDALQRSLRFHPERHFSAPAGGVSALVDEKRVLVAQQPPKGEGKARRDRLDEINRALQPWLVDEHQRLRRRRAQSVERLRTDRLMGSREYSFCLHSWSTLPGLLLDLCRKPS